MIRDRRYKYAIDERGLGFMLYDLVDDPEEQNNLIGQPGLERLEQTMREALLERLLGAQWSLGLELTQGS